MPSDVLITPASSKIDFTDGSNATKRLNISGTAFSFNSNLNVLSSTSLSSAFKAEGVNGTLFEVVDDLSSSLMSVNTIGGLPVFEVFANNSIIAGQYNANDFVILGNKIGLGYASPVNKLSVSGAVSIGASYNVAAPSNGLIVQGDVGIGVTSFAYSNANRANLEMYGSGESLLALRNSTGNSYIQKSGADFYINNITNGFIAISNNGSERWRITSTGIFESNGAQTIRTSTGNLTLATNAGNGHVILSPHGTGNVGVGTATPSQKLEVQGNIKLGADGAGSYIYYVKDNEGTIINTSRSDVSQQGLFRSDGWGNFTVDKSIGIGYSLGSSFASSAIGNGNLYVLNSIGINTTSPLTKLDVRSGSITSGTATSTAGSTIIAGYYTAGALTVLGTEYASGGPVLGYAVTPSTSATGAFLSSTGIAIGRSAYTQDGGTHRWYIGASQTVAVGGAVTASEVMRININGNVGIGTTNPSHPLTVSRPTQAAAYQINLNNDTGIANGNYTGIRFSQGDGGTTELGSIRLSYFTTGSTALSFGVRNASQALYIGTDGNVGVNTTSPSYKLDVNGTTRFGGIVYNEAVQIDDFNYFNLQPYIESETLSTILSFGGTAPTFVTLTNTASPFSKVLSVSAYGEALMSDYIPVQAGETIYGEIWTYRATGAAGTAGVIYCGVQRYDKDKKMIDGNGGLNTSPSGYFIASNQTIPSNSTWTKYSGTLVLPISHTVYNTSDGGPVRYIRPYIIYNYTAGTILTYIGGWKIRKVQLTRDSGPVAINGSVAIGSNSVNYGRLQISATTTSPSLSATNPTDPSLIISNSDVAYGTMFATYGDGKGALQQRRTDAATYYDFSLQPHGGNVGVGTLSPLTKLHVAGAIGLYQTAGSTYLYYDHSGVNTWRTGIFTNNTSTYIIGHDTGGVFATKLFAITMDGNVGIGTTNPTNKLHVYSSDNELVFIRGTTAGAWINVQSSTSNLWSIGADGVNGFSVYNRNSNNYALIVRNDGNLGIGNITTASNKLHVNGSASIGSNYNTAAPTNGLIVEGNVGIGVSTLNAGAKLHVVGNADIGDSTADTGIIVRHGSGSAQYGRIRFYSASTNIHTIHSFPTAWNSGTFLNASAGAMNLQGTNGITFGSWNSIDVAFAQGGNNYFKGNVGIGITVPSATLHLNSTISGATLLRADGTNGTLFSVVDDLSDSLMSVNNSAGLPVLEVFADDRVVAGQYGANDFVLVNNKLGLGTNNPQYELDIVGPGTNAAVNIITRIRSSASSDTFNTGSVIAFTNTTTNVNAYSYIGSRIDLGSAGDNAQALIFATNATNTLPTEKMRIKSDGNVGIGITSPLGKVHIYGFLRVGGAANEQTGTIALGNDANPVGTYGDNGIFRGGIGSIGSGNYTNISSYQGIVFNVQAAGFGSQATRMLIDINGNVGIGATNPATLLQIGTGTPSSATGGIQFGDDTGTRLYRSAPGIVTCSGTIAATFSGNLTGNVTGNATNVTGTVAIANGGTGATTAANARTNLGATTVGANLFILPNVTTSDKFLRVNFSDNTVSALDAAAFRTAIGAGTGNGNGTVTSVGGTGTVSGLTLSGTVTTTGNLTLGGTLSVTASNFASQTANTFLSAPNGAAGVPTFRAIVAADVPTLNQNTTGNANTASLATTSDRLTTADNRTISPSEDDAYRLRFGFTSWANNDSSPYADYLHLRSYSDSSGGNDNLVMFRKDAIGMRIYQAGFGTSVAYSSFKDVAFTDQSFFIGTTSVAINRASAALTLSGVNISGTAASETFATVTGRGSSTTTQISVGTTSSGSMYTGIKSGAGYSDTVSGATFKSITDHPTGGSFAFAAYYNGAPGTGTNSFYVAANGGAYFAQGVGIGVTSPLQALHINGNIILDGTTNGYTQSTTRGIGYGSNNGAVSVDGFSGMDIQSVNAPAPNNGNYSQNLRFWTHHYGTGTGATPRMFLQYNGNLGIGTVSPTAKLNVLSTSSLSSVLKTEGVNGTLFEVTDDLSNSLMSVNTIGGLPVFEVFANNSVIAGQYGQNDFVISGNKVGIGTASPVYKLNVIDNINSEPYSVAFFRNTNTSTSFGGIIVNGNNQAHIRFLTGASTWGAAGAKQWQIRTGAANNVDALSIYSWTTGSDVLYINSSGNVGINNTNPGYKLDVNGTSVFRDTVNIGPSIGTITWGNFGGGTGFGVRAESGRALSFGANGSFDHLVINTAGNVGVGTVSPNAKLDSYFSSNAITFNYLATNLNNNSPIPTYAFDVTNGIAETRSIKAGIGYERHETNGRGTIHIYNRSSDDASNFSGTRSSAGDIKMSINNVGNVGIGIVTPNAKLDVSGVIRGDAGANYPHSFTNTDAGNTHWTNRGDRLLTSNGAGWQTDGRDPIMALVTSGNTNNVNIANSIGLALHNESQTNNTFSPAIAFSNLSNSGSYNTTYAAIIGRKTGQGVDSNWSAGELHFYTMPVGAYVNNIPSLIINSAANIGIGTTNPITLLQVGTGTPTASGSGIQFGDDTSARIYRNASSDIKVSGGFQSSTYIIAGNYLQTLNNVIYPAGFSSTQRLSVGNAAQNAWIDGLTIAPGGNVVVAGTLTESSSIRYKENVKTIIAPILPKLNEIRPVTYNKKDNPNNIEYGIIAEELNDLFPELVNKNDNGEVESVNYSRLTVLLIKAVKELKQEIEILKNK